MYKINDIVTKKSGKPFKGGSKIDVIEKILPNPQSPSNETGAYLKYSKTIVSLRNLIVINSQPSEFIYLISSERYRESLDVTTYCMTDDDIKNYIINYWKEIYNEEVRNITIDYSKQEVTFEYLDFANDWEQNKMYLYKLKKFNNNEKIN